VEAREPTNRFDAIGVLNQESGSGSNGTFGYELFVQEIAPAGEAVLNIATKTVTGRASVGGERDAEKVAAGQDASRVMWRDLDRRNPAAHAGVLDGLPAQRGAGCGGREERAQKDGTEQTP
jgi:hypothetical protein